MMARQSCMAVWQCVLLGQIVFFVSIQTEENVLYNPRPCVDCQGYAVKPGEYYYDGCNVCYCYDMGEAECTKKWCKWNTCLQGEREEAEEKEERGEYGRRDRTSNNQRSRGHWWK